MTNLAKILTGLLFYAYDGIHQLRRLVFDNYQTCTFPLKLRGPDAYFIESPAVSQVYTYAWDLHRLYIVYNEWHMLKW